jgi:hypothetical protein
MKKIGLLVAVAAFVSSSWMQAGGQNKGKESGPCRGTGILCPTPFLPTPIDVLKVSGTGYQTGSGCAQKLIGGGPCGTLTAIGMDKPE